MLYFYKYQGTGNDFIIIDNRDNIFKNNTKLIKDLCNRKFGIGADGLICLEQSSISDFKMQYYNADGIQSTMCGNGGRCIVAFAKHLKLIDDQSTFEAVDGLHKATCNVKGVVSLKMNDVEDIQSIQDKVVLDTGSPHYIKFVEDIDKTDVYIEGKRIRNTKPYTKEGINVNFVEISNSAFKVRTYERGVEDETLSCGTGVTAVAIALHHKGFIIKNTIDIWTRGGTLHVSFDFKKNKYEDIWLTGPTSLVFQGQIKL